MKISNQHFDENGEYHATITLDRVEGLTDDQLMKCLQDAMVETWEKVTGEINKERLIGTGTGGEPVGIFKVSEGAESL